MRALGFRVEGLGSLGFGFHVFRVPFEGLEPQTAQRAGLGIPVPKTLKVAWLDHGLTDRN